MATNISGGVTTPTSTTHTGNGTTGPFSISFEYATRDDVQVFVGGVLKTVTTHYTFTSSTQITFTSGNAPTNGAIILIQRNTIVASPSHTFADASVLTATDLNQSNTQVLHGIQELVDDYVKRDGSQTIKSNLVFEGSTDDNNETTLAITNPTADRTITLPDTTGTVVTTGDTGSVSSTMITDGTIVDADINASAAISGSKLQAASGSNAGSMSASDKSKLDGIEANATADQTAAEIRTLVESATDSNVFTDADHTKLNAIEASATADQTAAEIRTLVESATDSNVFTDADHTKLNGIEANATADQTDAEIRAAVEAASDSNVFTDADHTKLNGIEANADVTDATNVDAAGAVMNSDLATKGQIIVGDGSGDPTILSVGQNNYVLVADSNEASGVKWATVPAGSGLSNLVEDTTPQLGGALDVQAQEINTSTTNGNIKLNPNGTGVVEVKGDGSSADGTIQLNCSQNSHGVKIKSPAHSAGASYTLTLPVNIVNGQFLKTDTNGNLSWAAVDLTALSASNLTSGTVPDARFPATLPAASGTNLTNLPSANLTGALPAISGAALTSLNATNLGSGTIPDARFPATLPAASAANLTSIPAANITGTLPAISGANLTDLDAADLASGTIPDARFPATLPAASAANLTSIPAANITGTLPAISATNLTNIPAANITGTLPAIDGSNLTGITAGAQGGGGESIFFESENTMNNNYTISSNHNALVAGPLTIASGATLTINDPSVVTIP